MEFLRKHLSLILIFIAVLPGAARAASEARTDLPGSIRALDSHKVRSVRPLRTEHLTKKLEVMVALRMRDYPKLLARVSAGEQVSQAEMEAQYLPLPADYQAVVDWAKQQGLEITQTDNSRLGVFVKGTIAQLQTAMRTQFAEVSVADGDYTSAVTAPSLPQAIAARVVGVNGLQPHIHLHRGQTAVPMTNNSPPYLVKEIMGAYGASNIGYDGSGETIAILIDTFPESTDLTSFWSHNGISQSLTNITKIQTVAGTLDDIQGEETLDSEWTSGIASGAKVRIYASRDLDFVDLDKGLAYILNDLPNQPTMHELSISLGLGETEVSSDEKQTDANYFLSIARYGVTIFCSSGDDGARTDGALQPSYYSSDPSVTGVGGTTLDLYSSGAVSAETAWNGSGGGTSQYFSRPSWQVGTGVPAGTKRLVPDVASAADPNTGAYIFLQGSARIVGGTSWAAPTWAGFCAIINQARTVAGLGPVGMLNPKIYPLIGTSAFRDITSGNNSGFNAGTGYDEVTGIGTPIMSQLLPQLTNGGGTAPVISSFTPSAGPVGATVTISGVNLNRVTAVNFNGTPATTFNPLSSSTLTAVVPTGATTGPVQVVSGTIGSATSSFNFNVVLLPTNDSFSNAISISGTSGSIQGSNYAATKEPGEPEIAGNAGGSSVWWKWQAPGNGIFTFSTEGSSFDTLEGIYTGSAVSALTLVGENDDYGTSVDSSVTFTATAGTTYYIGVDGYQAATGQAATGAITLTWEQNSGAPVIANFTPQSGTPGTLVTVTGANFLGTSAVTIGGTAAGFDVVSDTQINVTVPANAPTGPLSVTGPLGTSESSANFVVIVPATNDNFANAALISGASGSVTGNSSGATREPDEPEITNNPGGKSIWYEWTAPSAGPFTFTTFGSNFDTLLGVYFGNVVTNLALVAQNDDFGNTVTSSVTFLANAGETYHMAVDGYNGAGGLVVLNWSKNNSLPVIAGFTPSAGPVQTTVDITGSNFTGATTVSIGSMAMSYTVVSDTEVTTVVPQNAISGKISVGNLLGTLASANQFTITAAPSNDAFDDAIPLTGATVHATGANVGATLESGEPQITGNAGGSSVWWSWTAPTTGVYAISTQGSSFDTLLGVFTGNAVDALTSVAQNDDDPAGGVTSYVTISASAGTVYRIDVDGLNGASGAITLSIYPQQESEGLYSTGFEIKQGFTAHQPIDGQDGWSTVGTGGNGIVTGYDQMIGQQAYVGFAPPTDPKDGGVFAFKSVDYSPVGTSEPIVTFSVEMAINDSTNNNYDDFQWRLYNSKGHNFFTLDFDNADLHVYYLHEGSNAFVPTGIQFTNNTAMNLVVTMDYAHNKWSATLDGRALVTNKPIRTSTQTFDFGDMDAVWQIYDLSNPGDNYMVFDNYSVVKGENPTPVITFQPQSQTVIQGNPVTLGVVATGEAPLFYQWLLNKKPLPGAEGSSLTISDVQTVNAGTYTVQVSNEVGMITSQAARLIVTPQPLAPSITKEPASMTVAAGSTATFTAAASGYPAPSYQWKFNGNPIPGATKPVLQVKKVAVSNAGNYTLVASNTLGSGTSTPAALTVGNSFASQKGTYNGMILSGTDDTIGNGVLRLTMSPSGAFSGSVIIGGRTYHLAGAFNAQGEWQGVVGKLADKLPVTVNLQVSLSGSSQVSATILSGSDTEMAAAMLNTYSKTGPIAPEHPAYTMILTGTAQGLPEGIGYAALTVDSGGNIRVTGKLSDNTTYSFASVVNTSGEWPFYASLYDSLGYIGGPMTFVQSGPPDLTGTLMWMRPATSKFGGYASGFSGEVAGEGFVYNPPAKGLPAISLGAQHQGSITFGGSVLSSDITGSLSLGPTGLLVSGNPAIKLTLVPKTGVFIGTVDAGFSKLSPFAGVLLQSEDTGAGFFQSPTVSGPVEITSP